MKHLLLLGALLVTFAGSSFAAELGDGAKERHDNRVERRQEMEAKMKERQDKREERRQERQDRREKRKEIRADAKEKLKALREEHHSAGSTAQ